MVVFVPKVLGLDEMLGDGDVVSERDGPRETVEFPVALELADDADDALIVGVVEPHVDTRADLETVAEAVGLPVTRGEIDGVNDADPEKDTVSEGLFDIAGDRDEDVVKDGEDDCRGESDDVPEIDVLGVIVTDTVAEREIALDEEYVDDDDIEMDGTFEIDAVAESLESDAVGLFVGDPVSDEDPEGLLAADKVVDTVGEAVDEAEEDCVFVSVIESVNVGGTEMDTVL